MADKRATDPLMEAAMDFCDPVKELHLGIQIGSIIEHGASVIKSGF